MQCLQPVGMSLSLQLAFLSSQLFHLRLDFLHVFQAPTGGFPLTGAIFDSGGQVASLLHGPQLMSFSDAPEAN